MTSVSKVSALIIKPCTIVNMLGNVGRTLLAVRGIQARLCNLWKLLWMKEASMF